MVQKNDVQLKSVIDAMAGDKIEHKILNEEGEPLLTFAADQFDKYIANQYAAYSEIEWELENSKNSFTKTKTFSPGDDIRSALFVDAIMSYGRVFATAEGRHGVKLEGTAHWVGSENESLKRHQELMDFRHKLIAHTGNSPYRFCRASIVTNVVMNDSNSILANSLPRDISFGISAVKMGVTGFGDEDIDKTALYIEKIILKVQEKKSEIEFKLTEIAIEVLLVKK